MGVIYVNDGYKKAKLPVDLKKSSVDIGDNDMNISVEDGENLVITVDNTEQDKIVQDEILNIG